MGIKYPPVVVCSSFETFRGTMFFLALLLLIFRGEAVFQNQSQTYGCNVGKFYEFDWQHVYTNHGRMPQSCKCSAASVSDSSCKVFDCDCSCDLTAGSCDHNCCCDPDCLDMELTRFQESEIGCILHVRLYAPPQNIFVLVYVKCNTSHVSDDNQYHSTMIRLQENQPDFHHCYGAESVNERYPMTYTGTTKQSVDQLLCVAVDNSDVKGTYFHDPGNFELPYSVFDESKGQKEFTYNSDHPGEENNRGTSTVRF